MQLRGKPDTVPINCVPRRPPSLIGRGNSIYDVQALMDHEQVTTTQLYAAHKMNVKRELVKDMEWELERKEGTERNKTE